MVNGNKGKFGDKIEKMTKSKKCPKCRRFFIEPTGMKCPLCGSVLTKVKVTPLYNFFHK